MEAITQRQLTALMKRWQRRLRLVDWKVRVKLVGKEEFDKRGAVYGHNADETYGFCEHLTEARTGFIWIVRPEELAEDDIEGRVDIENTLVHELLHLHFAPFADKHTDDDLLHEQAIEAITEALLKDE